MTEIILVRHGETDWNVQERFRGRADIELNATGRKQAELLAQYLKDVKFEAILTSPLERALKTAQIIATGHYRTPVEPVMDLIDIDFGEWQSLSLTDVKEKYAGLYGRWLKEPQRVRIPGGESLAEVRKRALKVVNDVVNRYEGAVVLVSHRVVNKVIILGLLGLDNSNFGNIKLDTCGITIFSYEDERYILTGHNDTSFLKSLPKNPLQDF
jgi:phosphoserine phosphatase